MSTIVSDSFSDPEGLVADYLYWAATRKNLRPLTIRSYQRTLKEWVEWLGDRPLDTVGPVDLEDFAARPRRNGAMGSAATRRREIVSVKRFYLWAVEREHLEHARVVTAVTPKIPDRAPRPIEDAVWVRLWTADHLTPQDRLWLGLGYFAGLRRFEIVTMAPSAVSERELRFERKGGGWKPVEYVGMVRTVAKHKPWVADGWEDWVQLVRDTAERRRHAEFLWPDSVGDSFNDAQRLNKRLVRLLEGAGLPGNAFSPHRLRHSCATNLLQCRVSTDVIADMLGHSNTSTTRGYTSSSGQLERQLDEDWR